MIRIAVVEDEQEFQAEMKQYIQRFSQEEKEQFEVTYFQDGLDIVEEYQAKWDLIFLDIKMKHMDGMAAAHKIREVDPAVILIFITTMSQYAIKGYEVDALDYVLKPLNYAQLATKLRKAVTLVKKKAAKKYLMLPIEDGKTRVSTEDILYVEVESHRVYIKTEDEIYSLRSTMSKVEALLCDCPFSRCNQSYLVNLQYVTKVKKDTVYVGEDILPISRPKRKQFLSELSDYMEAGY